MLPTPVPSRAASARKVSADSPASSSSSTAALSTASSECEARWRPGGRRSADRVRGPAMTPIQPQLADLSNDVLSYGTSFDKRRPYREESRHEQQHCHHR